MFGKLFIIFCFVAIPIDAYAYLDPASGNALLSTLIALAGTSLYMCKSLFYKFLNRGNVSQPSSATTLAKGDQSLVLFSEGKTYWSTFRPIVEELIRQKKPFRYITLDVNDPALFIDSEYMQSRLYIKSRISFAKIAKIKSPVMLSTTPNIGCPGYPLRRPAQVGSLVKVFHAMANIADYRKGSLDHYDSVIMIGDHEEVPIRTVEAARQTKQKELVTCGLPYLDDLYRQKQESEFVSSAHKNSMTTILVAPSWGRKGCFSEYGFDFVEALTVAGYAVIVRVHPHSHVFEPEAVNNWREKAQKLPNVTWDTETFGTKAMMQADILVSDTSSIRFDFAFLYSKPVVTLDIPRVSREEFEVSYLKQSWTETVTEQLGVVVDHTSIGNLADIVAQTLEDFPCHRLQELRDASIANFGNSAEKIVTYLLGKIEEEVSSTTENQIKDELNKIKQEISEIKKEINNIKKFRQGN